MVSVHLAGFSESKGFDLRIFRINLVVYNLIQIKTSLSA